MKSRNPGGSFQNWNEGNTQIHMEAEAQEALTHVSVQLSAESQGRLGFPALKPWRRQDRYKPEKAGVCACMQFHVPVSLAGPRWACGRDHCMWRVSPPSAVCPSWTLAGLKGLWSVRRPSTAQWPESWDSARLWSSSAWCFLKNWSIVNFQCCVSFSWIAKWFSYIYIFYICVWIHLFQILFPYRLLQNIECSSLCYKVGPCWISIWYIVVWIC